MRGQKSADEKRPPQPAGHQTKQAYLVAVFIAALYFFFTALSCSFSAICIAYGNSLTLCLVFNLIISPRATAVAHLTTVPSLLE